jgi:hypothetical protein
MSLVMSRGLNFMRKESGHVRTLVAALFLSTSMTTAVFSTSAQAQSSDDAFEAFSSSRYNFCDAKMLGAVWGMDPVQGKVEIGMKILNRIEGNLEPLLEQSRAAGNTCRWEDTGLTPQDARVLANVWETNVPEARRTAATHYTYGTSGQVRNALGR